MPDPLARIPDSFYSGDTLKWQQSYSDFPSTTYDLEITFGPASATAGAMIAIATTGGSPKITQESDGSFLSYIDPTTSLGFADDTVYHWTARVNDGTDYYTVERGRILARANLHALEGNQDLRSQIKTILDQIRDRMAGRSLLDQNSMAIGNRSISRMTVDELIQWESVFARKYAHEIRRERIIRGLPTARNVKVRFTG